MINKIKIKRDQFPDIELDFDPNIPVTIYVETENSSTLVMDSDDNKGQIIHVISWQEGELKGEEIIDQEFLYENHNLDLDGNSRNE